MKVKPKEVLLNLPSVLMFADYHEIPTFASNINQVLHGKVKVKYEELGMLAGQYVGLFYLQRNDEFDELRASFVQMIEIEEMSSSKPVKKETSQSELSIDQSDRSLYSMLVDSFVGKFLNNKLAEEADAYPWFSPKVFASEPRGGVLTKSWLVIVKAMSESTLETLRLNAEALDKSKDLTESIAGHTLLWAISNHNSSRNKVKASDPVKTFERRLSDFAKKTFDSQKRGK